MRGWIIDCYPDYHQNAMVIWLRTPHGVERIVDGDRLPRFFVWAPETELRELASKLEMIDVRSSLERRRIWPGDRERPTLGVTAGYGALVDLARTVDRWGGYRRYQLFNVDLRFDQRYFLHHGIFPMGLLEAGEGYSLLDSPFRMNYPLPPLTPLRLEMKVGRGIPTMGDRIWEVRADGVVFDGPEDSMIEDLIAHVRKMDPDIIYTDGGDDFHLPHLQHRAREHGIDLELGREEGVRGGGGKSYFTYGRIAYKPPAYKLRGRIHIDRGASFMFAEGGLYGLIDLSRLCGIPVQELSRLSPGSAISAMQVNEAVKTGHLIRWKKNLPEEFKTARELLVCDRGGFIYEPEVGIHDGVVEVDFSSLYPNIMVRFNISPETVKCGCCPDSSIRVPEIGYRICERRMGLIPQVLEPIIRRRMGCKKLMREGGERREIYEQRSKILKWVLVTCFGYTGYRNARFGRIECHESITAYGREILLRASQIAEEEGFRVIHGIVDSLWLRGEGDPSELCKEVEREFGIPLELEGRYRWIVFLPCVTHGMGALNRYYGLFENGTMKVRGIALRRSDTSPIVREMQGRMLHKLSLAGDSNEFLERIPDALGTVMEVTQRLKGGEVPPEELVIRKRVSKELWDYRQLNDSVATLRQLRARGHHVPPGRTVEYIVTDGKSKDPWSRVAVASLVDEVSYDVESYLDLVIRGAAEILLPFNWGEGPIREWLSEQGC